MSKVLSIELGYSLVRVCEVDYKTKKPKVYANFEFKSPENVLEDGFIRRPEELGNALRAALDKHGIKTKQVIYSISSAKIASRESTLPFVKENKLEELVNASATDVFPVDISNCKITYQILDTQDGEDGTKKYHVSLFAAPNDLLESYYTMSTIAGLQIVALDYSSNSFAVAIRDVFKNGTYMAIKVDERSSLITVIRDGKVALQRTVPYGGDVAIDTIIDLEEQESGDRVSYEKALGLLQMRSCIRCSIDADVADDEDGSDEKIKQFRMSVAESFTMFNSSIMRVIDYYNSRNSDNVVDIVYVTGYAETFIGLTQLMSNELGIPVDRLSDKSSDIFQGLAEGGAYINCIGASIESMDFIPDVHSEKKGKVRKIGHTGKKGKPVAGNAVGTDPTAIALVLLIVCLVVAGGLAAYALLPYFAAEKDNEELRARDEALTPIREVYYNKVYSDLYLEQCRQMYATTQTQNDNLLKFIAELENVLPKTVNVLSFTSEVDKVTIEMQVESKEAAAKSIQEIRKFKSIESVTVGSVNEELNELGGSVVSFTLEAVYAPFEAEADETATMDDGTAVEESGDGSVETADVEEEVAE